MCWDIIKSYWIQIQTHYMKAFFIGFNGKRFLTVFVMERIVYVQQGCYMTHNARVRTSLCVDRSSVVMVKV